MVLFENRKNIMKSFPRVICLTWTVCRCWPTLKEKKLKWRWDVGQSSHGSPTSGPCWVHDPFETQRDYISKAVKSGVIVSAWWHRCDMWRLQGKMRGWRLRQLCLEGVLPVRHVAHIRKGKMRLNWIASKNQKDIIGLLEVMDRTFWAQQSCNTAPIWYQWGIQHYSTISFEM
jgi:hypothetical protein